MCLTLDTRYKSKKAAKEVKPLIAARRIIVYKSLSRYGDFFQSPYQDMHYKEGEHYYQERPDKFGMRIKKMNGYWQVDINEGLHCHRTREKALTEWGNTVIEMIIPKGAEYYETPKGIVTDNLIWPWKD